MREKIISYYLSYIYCNIIAPQNQKSYIYIFINSDLIIVIVIIRRGNREKKETIYDVETNERIESNSIQFNSLYRRVLVIYFKFRRCRRYIHFIIQFVAFLLFFFYILFFFSRLEDKHSIFNWDGRLFDCIRFDSVKK